MNNMSKQETAVAFEETWKASSTMEHLNVPLVSIVIPCHNYGKFLAEAIKSALNQTYINIEVLVIDDESTDNTREIAEQFDVTYIKTKHQGKATPAHAHNVGLQACHGDFVIFLGADDKLEPDYVKKCYAAFCKTQRKTGFVWTGFKAFGTSNAISLPKVDILTRFNCDAPSGQLGAMFVPKYMYEIIGDYDEALNGLEDLDWVIRACSKGFVGISVRETLHNYRFHGTSVNSNAGKKQVIRELFRKHPLFFLLYNLKLWTRRLKNLFTENHRARIKLYNKTAARFFHVPRLVEPPANIQNCRAKKA